MLAMAIYTLMALIIIVINLFAVVLSLTFV